MSPPDDVAPWDLPWTAPAAPPTATAPPTPNDVPPWQLNWAKPAAPHAAPEDQPSFLGTIGQAGLRGIIEGGTDVAQATQPFTDRPPPAPDKSYVGKMLNTPFSEGWSSPNWWAAHIGYGAGSSAPSVASSLAGAGIGAALTSETGPGAAVGALGGGAAGFGLGSAIQELPAAYQRARADGLDHDAAVSRAMKEAGIAGATGTVMGAVPGVSFFGRTAEGMLKRPISEALAQIFGAQPVIGAAGQVATGAAEGKMPTADELATGAATNVGLGAALAGGHALLRGREAAPEPPPAPRAEPEPAPLALPPPTRMHVPGLGNLATHEFDAWLNQNADSDTQLKPIWDAAKQGVLSRDDAHARAIDILADNQAAIGRGPGAIRLPGDTLRPFAPEPPPRAPWRAPTLAEERIAPEPEAQPTEAPPAPAAPAPPRAAPTSGRPADLLEFLSDQGGVQDQRGELSAMDAHRAFLPGRGMLVRKNGLTLDYGREAAEQAGYIPPGSTVSDFLEAIRRNLTGDHVFSDRDVSAAMAWQGQRVDYAGRYRDEVERRASQLGIEVPPGMSTEELLGAIHEREAIEAEPPVTPIADRIETDLDKEHAGLDIPGFEDDHDTPRRAAAQQASAETPREAPREPGAERGAEAGTAAHDPLAESRAAIAGAGARRAPVVELTDQGEQFVLPGAERSARQAAASREAEGRGMLTTNVAQRPADVGLFARAETPQPELFGRQPRQAQPYIPEVIRRDPSGRPIQRAPIPPGATERLIREYEKRIPGEPEKPTPKAPATPAAEAQTRAQGRQGAQARPGSPAGAPARQPPTASPGMRATAQRLGRQYMKTFQPELVSQGALRADPQFAKYAAGRAQRRDAIIAASQREIDSWRRVPEAERLYYLDRLERGAIGPNDPRAAQAARHRAMLDDAHFAEATWGSKAGWIENYAPHIWDRTEQARQWGEDRAVASGLGPKWFQKERTIDYIREGIDAGLKLKTSNPEELIQMRLLSGADMRSRMELLDDLNKQRLAFPIAGTDVPNRGWFQVDAPNRERWAVRDDLAALWKNAVEAEGLWANEGLVGDAFRGWMGLKNAWVPVKLSLSMFHPVHVLHINFSNSMARALMNIARGNFSAAPRDILDAFNFKGAAVGKQARAAWLKNESDMTQSEHMLVDLMKEGGFVPQLSEQLRIAASQSFRQAAASHQWLRTAWHGMRLGIEKMQAPIFEKWIPNLKAAAYIREATDFLKRNPHLYDDPVQRGIALRQIGKGIDARFGEMFYGGMFWNRTIKDAGVGSFLSLGWQLGFLHQFGGGFLLDPAVNVATKLRLMRATPERALMRDARMRTAFALVYTGTAMAITGLMTKAFTGEDPKGLDYFLPRVGGVNSDGSAKRLSTPFYTREVPMFQKHVQAKDSWLWGATDMLYNKLLFEPFREIYNNRNYYGFEIADTNAPLFKQVAQYAQWALKEQFDPLTVSQYSRVQEAGGGTDELVLSFMGFGPAPAYAARTAMQNRISELYEEHVAPVSRPHDEQELADAKRKVRMAMASAVQTGNDTMLNKAIEEAHRTGVDLRNFFRGKSAHQPGDIVLFRALPAEDQLALMRQATPDERRRYQAFTHKAVRARIAAMEEADQD